MSRHWWQMQSLAERNSWQPYNEQWPPLVRVPAATNVTHWVVWNFAAPSVETHQENDTARDSSLDSADYPQPSSTIARARYLKGALERVTVHEVGDNSDLKLVYREIAEARFCDIASAIRAHARLRADPFMISVHITCRRRHGQHLLPTTVRDLCRRIFGVPCGRSRWMKKGVVLADVTFFRARLLRGFTLRGRKIYVDAAADAEDGSADADANVDRDEGASADTDENANVDVKDTSAGERADTDADVSTSVDPNTSVSAEDAHPADASADERPQARSGTEYAQLQDRNERPLPDHDLAHPLPGDAQPPTQRGRPRTIHARPACARAIPRWRSA
ncbi:hypothetical protein B0H14DRAFT_3144806 [Mycena olivaceomarginata]|nr:hypothetical protein B0H14DRAFT_3144806 [Mycena olivaceomarginata]